MPYARALPDPMPVPALASANRLHGSGYVSAAWRAPAPDRPAGPITRPDRLISLRKPRMFRADSDTGLGVFAAPFGGRGAGGMPPPRILLAEDEPAHQHLLRAALERERADAQVHVVATGTELLDDVRVRDFGCILLDFNLPDYRADELLEILRQHDADLPVIVISSSREQDVVIRSLRCGSVDFVPKSDALQPGCLWSRIDLAMSRRADARAREHRRRNRLRRIVRLAESDPLTGLANRRALHRALDHHRRRTYDRRGRSSMLMIDVDGFKQVNDRAGHAAGDAVLCSIAGCLTAQAGAQALTCRWGGDEFLVVRASPAVAETFAWAESLQHEIKSGPWGRRGSLPGVTVSIGFLNVPSVRVGEHLLPRADAAVYLAKRLGRNRVCSWEMAEVASRVATALNPGIGPDEGTFVELIDASGAVSVAVREHLQAHPRRVSRIAVALGRDCGLDPQDLEILRLAGLYHDFGKLWVPRDLLVRPAALSPQEQALVRRCCRDGGMLLQHLGADHGMAECVSRQVLDGGEEMKDESAGQGPPSPRDLLRVADAVDAMISPRPYRPAMTPDDVIRELRAGSGRQFHPQAARCAILFCRRQRARALPPKKVSG